MVKRRLSRPWSSLLMSGEEAVWKTSDSVVPSGKMWENWNFSQGLGRRRALGTCRE